MIPPKKLKKGHIWKNNVPYFSGLCLFLLLLWNVLHWSLIFLQISITIAFYWQCVNWITVNRGKFHSFDKCAPQLVKHILKIIVSSHAHCSLQHFNCCFLNKTLEIIHVAISTCTKTVNNMLSRLRDFIINVGKLFKA